MKKKASNSNDIIVMQDIIDNLNEKNRILNNRIECLEEQLDVAYSVNKGLQDEQKDDEDYQNLTKLNVLLLIIMGLTQTYCKGSDLGRSVGRAIENFYADTALSLVKKVDFRLRGRDNDEEEFDDDEGGEEEF